MRSLQLRFAPEDVQLQTAVTTLLLKRLVDKLTGMNLAVKAGMTHVNLLDTCEAA